MTEEVFESQSDKQELPPFGDSEEINTEPSTAPAPERLKEAPPPPAPSKRSAIEDMKRRIDRLYAQKRAAEENWEQERGRVRELEAKIRELEARFAPTANPFLATSPAPQPSVREDFSSAVQEAIRPVVERLEYRERVESLRDAQEESWAAAEAEFPEAVGDSEVRQLAEYILRRDPELRLSPNGPYRAVVMARGYLAGAPRGEPKQAAQSVVSATGAEDSRSVAKLKKEYNELLQRGITTPAEYLRAKELRNQLRGK